jgi:hypothetical protein
VIMGPAPRSPATNPADDDRDHTHTHTHRNHDPPEPDHRSLIIATGWIGRPGGHRGGPAPDPIPNSAVKTPSAHGTVPQGTGESVAARSSNPPSTPRARPTNPAPHIPPNAGWSSPVARQAHNLKAAGSNPAPATSINCRAPGPKGRGLFSLRGVAKLSSLCRNSLKRRL